MEQLDRVTLERDGRFYIAKDDVCARCIQKSDPRSKDYLKYRNTISIWRICFRQSERLGL